MGQPAPVGCAEKNWWMVYLILLPTCQSSAPPSGRARCGMSAGIALLLLSCMTKGIHFIVWGSEKGLRGGDSLGRGKMMRG